jgi:hypothetical protein
MYLGPFARDFVTAFEIACKQSQTRPRSFSDHLSKPIKLQNCHTTEGEEPDGEENGRKHIKNQSKKREGEVGEREPRYSLISQLEFVCPLNPGFVFSGSGKHIWVEAVWLRMHVFVGPVPHLFD